MDSGLVNNLGQWHAGLLHNTGFFFLSIQPSVLAVAQQQGSYDAVCMLPAGKYRKYSYGSLRDLLRVIRNKHNHFR